MLDRHRMQAALWNLRRRGTTERQKTAQKAWFFDAFLTHLCVFLTEIASFERKKRGGSTVFRGRRRVLFSD